MLSKRCAEYKKITLLLVLIMLITVNVGVEVPAMDGHIHYNLSYTIPKPNSVCVAVMQQHGDVMK